MISFKIYNKLKKSVKLQRIFFENEILRTFYVTSTTKFHEKVHVCTVNQNIRKVVKSFYETRMTGIFYLNTTWVTHKIFSKFSIFFS